MDIRFNRGNGLAARRPRCFTGKRGVQSSLTYCGLQSKIRVYCIGLELDKIKDRPLRVTVNHGSRAEDNTSCFGVADAPWGPLKIGWSCQQVTCPE